MSAKTQQMARQLYEQMCAYVGSNHEERCVEALTFTLDSMEVEVERRGQRIEELEVERDRLVEFIRSIDSRLDELLALNALREPAP